MLNGIISNLIFKTIFQNMTIKNFLNILRYNKAYQKRLNLTIQYYATFYREYQQIELDIITEENFDSKKYKFMIIDPKDRNYFHCFFNDEQEESQRLARENISKIKVKIDPELKS